MTNYERIKQMSIKEMASFNPCSCGSQPEIRTVGDYKQYFTCFCPKCNKSPMRFDEAQMTKQGAIKIWNRRINNDL